MNTEIKNENHTAEELLKSTVRNVSELASIASHQIEETVNKGKTKITEMQSVLSDKTKECARTTDQYVHDNPWKAIGLAASVGLILGLLMRRR
jgi:ElaB/YqjD/DUF883 family membrane-anchored ribosome-binding protein